MPHASGGELAPVYFDIPDSTLHLKELEVHDARAMFDAVRASTEHLKPYRADLSRNCSSAEATARYIEKRTSDPQRVAFGVWDEEAFVGEAALLMDGWRTGADFSYWIAAADAGKGHGTRAARAVRDYGFERLGLQAVCAYVRPKNIPSQRALVNAGFNFVFQELDECYFIAEAPKGTEV